jgi:hypothetical protein
MCDLFDSSLDSFDLAGWVKIIPEPDVQDAFYSLRKEDFDSHVPIETVSLIWEKRLTMDQIIFLAKNATSVVVLYARQREQWISIASSMVGLFSRFQLRFLHSSDRGRFTLVYRSINKGSVGVGLFDTPAPVIQNREETVPPVINIYMVAKGPTPYDVQAYDGQPESIEATYPDAHVRWGVCAKPTSQREINVPLSIRALWLRQHFAPRVAQRLKDPTYYEMAIDSYTIWSYPIHAAQISHICDGIPQDSTLVAPGDGVGVAARVWKGSLVAGDRVVTSLTHTSVVEEDLWDTVCRGAKAKDPVFVLSYISTFLSERLVSFFETTMWPVIVLENKNTCTLRGFTQYGPGLFTRNVPLSWPFRNLQLEKAQKVTNVMYSENLIRRQAIAYYSENEYVKYVRSMRPYVPESPLFDRYDTSSNRVTIPYSDDVPIVCATVQELLLASKEHPYGQFYFGPTGNSPGSIVEVPSFALSHTLQRRRIYYTPLSDPYVPALIRSLPTEQGRVNGRGVLFFWYAMENDRELILDYSSPEGRGYVLLSFSKEAIPIQPIATILFPFVFVRVPGRIFQAMVAPESVSVKHRCLSALSQLPCHGLIVQLIGKSFGVTTESWWHKLMDEMKDYEEGVSEVVDVCSLRWTKHLESYNFRNEKIVEVYYGDDRVAQVPREHDETVGVSMPFLEGEDSDPD